MSTHTGANSKTCYCQKNVARIENHNKIKEMFVFNVMQTKEERRKLWEISDFRIVAEIYSISE